MCLSNKKAIRQATAQAARDAEAARAETEKDRAAMIQQQQETRRVLGETAPPPAPYRTRSNKPGTGGVRTKKPKRTSSIGAGSLRNSLNIGGPTGGGPSGGINVG